VVENGKSWWETLPREGFTQRAKRITESNVILPTTEEYLRSIEERRVKEMKEGWNE
jgi:hypothetical protein